MNAIIRNINGIEVKAFLEYVSFLDTYAVRFEFANGWAAKCTMDADGNVSWFGIRNDVHWGKGADLLRAFDVAALLGLSGELKDDAQPEILEHISEDAPVAEVDFTVSEAVAVVVEELEQKMKLAKIFLNKDHIFYGNKLYVTSGQFLETGIPYRQQGLKSILREKTASGVKLEKLLRLRAYYRVLSDHLDGVFRYEDVTPGLLQRAGYVEAA